jgi:hypothetical protein
MSFPFDRIDTSLDIVKTYTDGVKTKTFDIHGELDGAKLFAKNDSVNMIMSSKNKVSAEDIKDVTIPSFLDSDF